MTKGINLNENLWKIVIILTLVISIVCLVLLVQCKLSRYEYYTKTITLDNTNDYEYLDGVLVKYLCDEGVYFNNHRTSYYASTSEWLGDVKEGFVGSCMLRIRRLK